MHKIIRNYKEVASKGKSHTVTLIAPLTYEVESGHSGNLYQVELVQNGATCTCDWGTYRGRHDHRSACSHVQAVYRYIEEQNERIPSAWGTEEQARRQHRPIRDIGDGVLLTTRRA